MAILDNKNCNYYKIDFDNCSVRGRKVFVTFTIYESAAEREKEKDRLPKWPKYHQALREKLDTAYKALLSSATGELEKAPKKEKAVLLQVKEVSPYLQSLPEEEQALAQFMKISADGKIDKVMHPELRAMQDAMDDLQPYEGLLQNSIYAYGDQHNKMEIPANIEKQLEELGFDPAWVTDPIKLSGKAEVCVGDYNDEHIDHEFYYNRLKAAMPGDIADC